MLYLFISEMTFGSIWKQVDKIITAAHIIAIYIARTPSGQSESDSRRYNSNGETS